MKTLFILAICAGAYLGHGEMDEAADQYCQMTAIYKATRGAAGWPPYLGAQCEVPRAEAALLAYNAAQEKPE